MPLSDQPGFDPGDYTTNGGTFNTWKYYLHNLPAILGRWIGQGVNAYTESSTQFERYWNSPLNQMDQYDQANVNPYEGFLSGSGGNGNPIQTASADPMSLIGSYLGNFVSLAQGLQELRSKKLANDSSQIDLLRKQFENRWFFGDPGQVVSYETTDEKGNPIIVTEKKGYIQSKPERDYIGQMTGNKTSKHHEVVASEAASAAKYRMDEGYTYDLEDYNKHKAYYDRLNTEYSAKRNKISYEWERYLKEELGVDPRANPYLTTVLNWIGRIAQNNNQVGRAFFAILKFLKGDFNE